MYSGRPIKDDADMMDYTYGSVIEAEIRLAGGNVMYAFVNC